MARRLWLPAQRYLAARLWPITKFLIPPTIAPANYYNSATGTGTTLRTNLHNIITSGYTGYSYGDSRSILPILWEAPNNSNNMILTYSNENIAKPNPNGTNPVGLPGWDQGTTWNREHTWPQSLLGVSVGNTYVGPASDLFELTPARPSINSSRSNKPYGITSSSGSYSSQSTYFFPGDAQKGDSARTIFYMATCFYNGSGTASINNLSIVDGLSPSTYQMGDLQALLKWNYTDGVDNFERRKNDSSTIATRTIAIPSSTIRNTFGRYSVVHMWQGYLYRLRIVRKFQWPLPPPTVPPPPPPIWAATSSAARLGTSNVTVSKSGTTPTTFDITTSGNAITTGSNLLAGTGHPFDYGSQSKSMTVGLTGSTATAGAKTGTVTINNTDLTTAGTGQGSADGDDTVTVNATVLDHANASFATPSDTNSTSVNVGIYKTGTGTQTAGFNIYNLVNTASFTAGLQYVSQSGSGDTGQLSSNIATAFTERRGRRQQHRVECEPQHHIRRHLLRRVYADAWRRRQRHRSHQPERNPQSLRPSAQQRNDLLDRGGRQRLGFEPHQNQLDRSVLSATCIWKATRSSSTTPRTPPAAAP